MAAATAMRRLTGYSRALTPALSQREREKERIEMASAAGRGRLTAGQPTGYWQGHFLTRP
jgi:hypothetical protein